MKAFACLLCFFIAAQLVASDQYLTLTNQNGVMIMAQPIKLNGSTLSIKRSDGLVFDMPLSGLDEKSRQSITDFFKNQPAAAAATDKLDSGTDLQLDRNDQFIDYITYSDRIDDYMKMHKRDEMDIRTVKLERDREGMRIEIDFIDAPGSLTESEYRIWLNFDLDLDTSTGMTDRGKEGVDMAIAIHGNGSSSKWTSYNVPKSDVGRDAEFEIKDIKVTDHGISFLVASRELGRSDVYGISITSLADGGKVLDKFPDGGLMTFSFDYEALSQAQAGVN